MTDTPQLFVLIKLFIILRLSTYVFCKPGFQHKKTNNQQSIVCFLEAQLRCTDTVFAVHPTGSCSGNRDKGRQGA